MTTTSLGEQSERTALSDLLAAPTPAVQRALGLHSSTDKGCLVLAAPGLDCMMFNRASGVATPEQTGWAVAQLRQLGATRFLVHQYRNRTDTAVTDTLRADGVERYHRSWAKFQRSAGRLPTLETDLRIDRATPCDADAIRRIEAKQPALAKHLAWAVTTGTFCSYSPDGR